jgi:hypothetical protein
MNAAKSCDRKQQTLVNTINGIPVREFTARWVSMMWFAMMRTGKGYRRDTLKNRPPKGAARWRGERRADKPGTTKTERALSVQYA